MLFGCKQQDVYTPEVPHLEGTSGSYVTAASAGQAYACLESVYR